MKFTLAPTPFKSKPARRGTLLALLTGIAIALGSLFIATTGVLAQNDGCYICQGQQYTFVKFEGKDNWDKRKKAEECGCKVGGTTSSCDAANYKILCEVK